METHQPLATDRPVHRFDFNEQPTGNMENVPRHWRPLRMEGFPRYARGHFDVLVGHDEAPSFYLQSEGRNVAYEYLGHEIPAVKGADYRVEVWIKTHRLEHARTCISACFQNSRNEPIHESMVRSDYLDQDSATHWSKVELFLLDAPPESTSIGIQLWVLQEGTWRVNDQTIRPAAIPDVHGGAWFDDIGIYSLPRVTLEVGGTSHVLKPSNPAELRVSIDPNVISLRGRLTVHDPDGRPVIQRQIDTAKSTEISLQLDSLAPGLYSAHLNLSSDATGVLERSLQFALLSRTAVEAQPASRTPRYGVALSTSEEDVPTIIDLLKTLRAAQVKIPVFVGPNTASTHALIEQASKQGYAITAAMPASLPMPLDSESAESKHSPEFQPRQSIDEFSLKRGSAIGCWQLGLDDPPSPLTHDDSSRGCNALRGQLARFIPTPRLGISIDANDEVVESAALAEQISIRIDHHVALTRLPELIQHVRKIGYDRVNAYVPSLGAEKYQRRPRLSEWATRLVAAHHAGADTVFAPQTWRGKDSPQGSIIEPTEEFLILSTIIQQLGHAVPGPAFDLAQGVRALPFTQGDSSLLFVRDLSSPPQGRSHELQLGNAATQIDLWGRSTPLQKNSAGQHLIHLSPEPVFITGAEKWWIDFLASIRLLPAFVPGGADAVAHTVEFSNTGPDPISGQCLIETSNSVAISPRTLDFRADPRGKGTASFTALYSHNNPAGKNDFTLSCKLDRDGRNFERTLSTFVGLENIDVWAAASIEGDDLLLRHTVCNRSSQKISFRGTAAVPGRERRSQPFDNIPPGETQTRTYRFPDAESLIGRKVHLSLREVNDGPRSHQLMLTVP